MSRMAFAMFFLIQIITTDFVDYNNYVLGLLIYFEVNIEMFCPKFSTMIF